LTWLHAVPKISGAAGPLKARPGVAHLGAWSALADARTRGKNGNRDSDFIRAQVTEPFCGSDAPIRRRSLRLLRDSSRLSECWILLGDAAYIATSLNYSANASWRCFYLRSSGGLPQPCTLGVIPVTSSARQLVPRIFEAARLLFLSTLCNESTAVIKLLLLAVSIS